VKETGIDRNPADLVEVNRPDDSRQRYLSEDFFNPPFYWPYMIRQLPVD
jgi:hypothetical protein